MRRLLLAERPLCVHCEARGVVTAAEEIDHVRPLEQGGTNDVDNLQPLCKSCHQTKTTGRAPIGLDGFPIDRTGGM